MKTYKHLKTGNLYDVIGYAKNCTNANDGQKMVLYRVSGSSDDLLFVRESEEFLLKFIEV